MWRRGSKNGKPEAPPSASAAAGLRFGKAQSRLAPGGCAPRHRRRTVHRRLGRCRAGACRFVRSTFGHADIVSVDTAAAAGMPGVLAVITGQDLVDAGIGPIPPLAIFTGRDGQPMFSASMPVLAATRVRYVGEPVALVVAETAAQALDAAEAVTVEYRSAPRRRDVDARDGAGRAANLAGGRRQHRRSTGRKATPPRVDAAFARAAHVERVRLLDTRLAPSAMEPRAALATFDAQVAALHPDRADARRGRGAQDPDRSRVQGSGRARSGSSRTMSAAASA